MFTETLGRYQILSEIGQGAMGKVFQAIDPLIERTVAIKTISLGLSKDEFQEFEARFYREAKSAGRLNHPNIVTIFDVGNTDKVAWIAMELLAGESLREVLDSGAVLPMDRIVDIGTQIADGLAAAHAAHVVHRDIKPANIMILTNGQAKITDFGVALIPSSSRTMEGVILGSPKYMSPEQVIGQPIDGRSDICSLGAVLYEMLTGRPPFAAEHIGALMYKVINEVPPAPSNIMRSIPQTLDYIVLKAMAKHPDDRYQSAAELAADLRRFRELRVPATPIAQHPSLERRKKPRVSIIGDETIADEAAHAIMHHGADVMDVTAPQPAVSATARPRRPSGWLLALAGGAVLAAGLLLSMDRGAEKGTPTPSARPAPATRPAALPMQAATMTSTTVTTATAPNPTDEAPPSRAKSGAARATARIELAISPWGEVFVDNEKVGTSPPDTQIVVPAGRHRIEVRNKGFVSFDTTVELKPNEVLRIKHHFLRR